MMGRRRNRQKPKQVQQKRQHQKIKKQKQHGGGKRRVVNAEAIQYTATELFGGMYYCSGKDMDGASNSQ